MIVEGLARRPKAPSHEQFVSAVIRAHERVLMGLSAMVRGAAHREAAPAGETCEDAEIIRSYFRAARLYGMPPTGNRSLAGSGPVSAIRSQTAL